MSALQDRTDAAAMISEAGQTVTLTVRSAGAYSPSTSSSTITETTITTKGVVLPMPRLTAIGFGDGAGSLVQEGDQQLLLSAVDNTGTAFAIPHANDKVTIGADVYALTRVSPLMPAGTVLFYECFIRGVPA